METNYRVLLYCEELEKEQSGQERMNVLQRRIRHLYNADSETPALDHYLVPDSICERTRVVFGAEDPEEIIEWASSMEEKVKASVWKVISAHQKNIAEKNLQELECQILSQMFEILGGEVNRKACYLVIDEDDQMTPWPSSILMETIKVKPECWALCQVKFRPNLD